VQTLKAFRGSLAVTVIVLIAVGVFSGSLALVAIAAILAVLEVTLSFDNAVVNAKYLKKMSPLWQKLFLTVGILIAVFGMRLVFPIVIVAVTANLGFTEVIDLALNDVDTYAEELEAAKAAIYSFGGIFLLMIFLDWVFERKDEAWLRPVERTLEKAGSLNQLSVVLAGALILYASTWVEEAESNTVLFSGFIGLITYLVVSGLDSFFDEEADDDDDGAEATETVATRGGAGPAVATAGKAGFSTFLYLEVLDASFSFDGVIGAFAISTNVLVIAAGLGIGAVFVRSMTVYLVRQGTLAQYRYLEHGAHWAIGALAVILILELEFSISEFVTGLLGLGFILSAYTSSVLANKKDSRELLADGLADDGKGIDERASV
jgi:hypothetical protein